MKKLTILITLLASLSLWSTEQLPTFKVGSGPVDLIIDGRRIEGGWRVSPHLKPDILETTASQIAFLSNCDTLLLDNLKEWSSHDFVMLTSTGDSAHVRITRNAANPFENPNPELLTIPRSGMLSKRQAEFDLDALIYGLNQVHPDIFSICKQADLMQSLNRAKATLPDSLTLLQLYQRAAPIVAMIGDGHTNLIYPYNSVFTADLKRFPVYVEILTDRTILCTKSPDSIIGAGDKILAINNISTDSIINTMLPFVSGEREHFKLSRLDHDFTALFEMLYRADSYEVTYQPRGTKKLMKYTFPAATWAEIKQRMPATRSEAKLPNYSFTADSLNNVAVMDFRQFYGYDQMEQFADSMFATLARKKITNLIIDLRNNPGGQSGVGDILLRYISPKPFVQMSKALIRITPLTAKLMGEAGVAPTLTFVEVDSTYNFHRKYVTF